jgi:lactoylglutathione lyase
MSVKINKIQHIGLPITIIDRSIVFYESLGFKSVMRSTFQHQGAEGKVAMMQRDEMIIELYQMPEPELSNVRNRKDGKIDHIAFDVDDIDVTYQQLKLEGFHILEPEPVFLPFWEKGCKFFNIEGPDKERLEFCQIIK